MKRSQVINAMKAAGARGDKAAFTRLYIEHRISRPAADEAWRAGAKLGEFVRSRDAAVVAGNESRQTPEVTKQRHALP